MSLLKTILECNKDGFSVEFKPTKTGNHNVLVRYKKLYSTRVIFKQNDLDDEFEKQLSKIIKGMCQDVRELIYNANLI